MNLFYSSEWWVVIINAMYLATTFFLLRITIKISKENRFLVDRERDLTEIDNKINRSSDLIKEWHDRGLIDKVENAARGDKRSIFELLSYFERVGLLYKHQLLRADLMFDHFSLILSKLENSAMNYIKNIRSVEGGNEVWSEAEYFINETHKRKNEKTKSIKKY